MRVFALLAALLISACGNEGALLEQANEFGGRGGKNQELEPVLDLLELSPPPANPDGNAYFGDLHVHTQYSFDAYSFGTTATPYDAYRYARGEALTHPSGYQIQLQTPLDFYAVTDHAMFLGLVKEAADTSTEFSKYDVAKGIHNLNDPGNSNGSNGQMFKLEDWAGNPIDDDYARQRMRNEPLVEVTQVKGTSDTHPLLSPNDEWADFEIYSLRVGTGLPSEPRGSYVREAYQMGLQLEEQGIANPYQFGLVAASDTHVAGTTDDESTYFSKAGILDGEPYARGSVPVPFLYGALIKLFDPSLLKEVDGKEYIHGSGFESWSASGVTGVWATENTREAIYEAFRRKETFATTGPRIKVRLFAGTDYRCDLLQDVNMVRRAYDNGVAMGGELQSAGQAPKFLVWASGDPRGMALQRAQIIKGYMQDGEPMEMVYDVACSDGASPDPSSHRCPDNGARVSLADCSVTQDAGDVELLALWEDPDYTDDTDAFYYLRVLENLAAAGLPGMHCVRGWNPGQICTKQSRNAPGVRRSGCALATAARPIRPRYDHHVGA